MTAHGLAHDALLYDSDEAFVSMAAPFLADGCSAGERAVAVTTPHNVDLLRGALDGAAPQVAFIDAAEWYQRPGATIEAYRRVLAEYPRIPARVIGEVDFGAQGWEQRAWTRYEAVLNHVFADQRAWIVCPYDTRVLPDPVIEHAAHTHSHLWRGLERASSELYAGPNFALDFAEPPPDGLPILRTRVRGAEQLGQARREIEDALAVVLLSEQRRMRGVFAIHEVLANVMEHGGGDAAVTLWDAPGRVVCEIGEPGPGPLDPLGTYLPPADRTVPGGLGLWLVHQLCEAVEITTTESGSAVRLSLATDTSGSDER